MDLQFLHVLVMAVSLINIHSVFFQTFTWKRETREAVLLQKYTIDKLVAINNDLEIYLHDFF